MAIVKIILLFMMVISTAFGSEITRAFKEKNYTAIVDIYKAAPNKSYTKNELVMISYSLRRMKFYRQDIKLNIRLVKKDYITHHRKLLKQIKESETVDPDEYPEAQKVLYWNILNDYGEIIRGYSRVSENMKRDQKHFTTFSKLLSELEFREGKVDKLNDQIVAHMQYLENKIYKRVGSLSVQYVSWQREAVLQGPSETDLIVTNKGICAGGDVGWENSFYHYYLDGCFLAGSGGVSAAASAGIKYQQSNVPAYGIKLSPGASMIVSSSKSRIGVRIPMIYSFQKLADPASMAYKVDQGSYFSLVTSLYSRWQFDGWYFQTEFGKYVQKDLTFWGLGAGFNF